MTQELQNQRTLPKQQRSENALCPFPKTQTDEKDLNAPGVPSGLINTQRMEENREGERPNGGGGGGGECFSQCGP